MPRSWDSMDEFEAFLDDGGIVEVDDDMPDAYRDAVFRVHRDARQQRADGRAHRADWIPRTPGSGTRWRCSPRPRTRSATATCSTWSPPTWASRPARDARGSLRRQEPLPQRVPLPGRHLGRSGGHRLPGRRRRARQPAGGLQELLLRALSPHPQTHHRRRGFPHAAGRGPHDAHRQGTDTQTRLFQESLDRWFWPALQLFGPDSKPDDELLRWHIKSERNEVLRDKWVQKFVPMLQSYGFTCPPPTSPSTRRRRSGTWARSTGSR